VSEAAYTNAKTGVG